MKRKSDLIMLIPAVLSLFCLAAFISYCVYYADFKPSPGIMFSGLGEGLFWFALLIVFVIIDVMSLVCFFYDLRRRFEIGSRRTAWTAILLLYSALAFPIYLLLNRKITLKNLPVQPQTYTQKV